MQYPELSEDLVRMILKPKEDEINDENVIEEKNTGNKGVYFDALSVIKDYVVRESELKNSDALAFAKDWKTFASSKQIQNLPQILQDDIPLNADEKALHAEIYDLLVQKVGNVRMVVRFNNAKLDDTGIGYVDLQKESLVPSEPTSKYFGMQVIKRGQTYNSMNVKYVSGEEKENPIKLRFAQGEDKSILQSNKTWKINEFEWNDEKVEQQLSFERIFMTEKQEKVFEDVKPFVLSALNGKNVLSCASRTRPPGRVSGCSSTAKR